MSELKVLELYSGIGGMHCALKLSEVNAKVVAAVDINPQANIVYKHNFKDTLLLQKTIEGIKLEEYNRLNFDVILMSPPCQPFTRQGNQIGAIDPRAKSFLSLLEIIPKLAVKPKFILMENVKGFDLDTAREHLLNMLKNLNYTFQEFLLSPVQFGIPNSRLRYFLIAKLNGSFTFQTTTEIMKIIPKEAYHWISDLNRDMNFDLKNICQELNKISDVNLNNKNEEQIAIDVQPYQINEDYSNCSQSESSNLFVKEVRKLGDFVCNTVGADPSLFLSQKQFEKSIKSADFVTINSTRTNCFTKNYGRYIEGTGSILKIDSENLKSFCVSMQSLRFLSPREITNLHCFPNSFEYPEEISTQQRWRLIGNSLNVFIVTILIKLMTQ